MTSRLGAILALALTFASGVGATTVAVDPPRLVTWRLIGNIGLGMTETRVEYNYGHPIKRYADNGMDLRTYRGRGQIDALYDRSGHVVWVSTGSTVYRTPTGFGVGSEIPLGPCHRVRGACVYRWEGFTLAWGEGGTRVWLGRFGAVRVRLEMTRNRVTWVAMYFQRPHVCYPFYVTCDGVR